MAPLSFSRTRRLRHAGSATTVCGDLRSNDDTTLTALAGGGVLTLIISPE